MYFRSKFSYTRTPKYYSTVDNVERESYVPLSIQYERLMLAGVQRDLDNSNQYYYEYNDFVSSGDSIEDYAGDNLHPHYMDKNEAFALYRRKVEKVKRFDKQEEKLKYLREEFKRHESEIELKRQAINEYKAEQDAKNRSLQ